MKVRDLILILNNCTQNADVYCGEQGRLAVRELEDVHKALNGRFVVLEYSNNQDVEL